jgi:PA14 domain
MKNIPSTFRTALAFLGLMAVFATSANAQFIYASRVTGTTWTPPFWEIPNGGTAYATSAGLSGQSGLPTRVGCFYHSANTLVVGQGFGCQLTNDTVPGATWIIEVTVPTSNSSADLTMAVGCTNGTLSVSQTEAFRTTNSASKWGFVGYVTNNPGTLHPAITFTYLSGANNRSYADCIRFTQVQNCIATAPVSTMGPYSAGTTNVTVTGVTNATAITVYQKIGAGAPNVIGVLTTGIVDGNNVVNCTNALVKGAQVIATQTVLGQEGCVPNIGALVGGGANPRVKISLDMRQTGGLAGPIGAAGPSGGGGLYFLQATGLTGSAPAGGIVVQPSTCWQTVKIDPRTAPQSSIWSGSWPGQTTPDRLPWAELECFAFCIDDLTDTGPFAIYIDNLANGTNMIQDFEDHAPGESVLFVTPNAAGFPLGMLINPPNIASVSTNNSSGGTNSEFVEYQFANTASGNWVRLYTGGSSGSYPQIDMTQPIYFDLLVLPLGQTNGHSIGTIGYLQDQTNCPGDNVTFSAPTNGTGSYTFQWKYKGNNIQGATGATFTTNNVATSSSGTYAVAISDGVCGLTRDASLTVEPVADIFGQPSDAVVNVGDPASFSVGASPIAPCSSSISYQWRRNGVNVANGTDAILNIQSAQVSDAGIYSVLITNSFGSVVSSNATLHVVDVANQVIGSGTGLLGLYYSNHLSSSPFLGTPAWTNVDQQIAFTWLVGAPDDGYNFPSLVNTDHFTVRWVGQIQGEWNQTYNLYTTNDDGLRLWVNGQLVIDSWVNQSGAVEHSGTIALTTNLQDILVEYFENTGNADVALSWDSPSQAKQVIQMSQLYPAAAAPAPPALTATVNNRTNLVFNWGAGTYTIAWATNVLGPYTNKINAVISPYTLTIGSEPQRYFRLQVQ